MRPRSSCEKKGLKMERLACLRLALPLLAMGLSGCNASRSDSPLARGEAAYAAISAPIGPMNSREYRIGVQDTLSVTVFQEPDLSLKELQVDSAGNIDLPLIGRMLAQGKTASELSSEIAGRLNQKYLENPHVSVTVAKSISQKVAVQGEVKEPGVFEIKGSTTLLEALSMAKGETRIAALREVVVFRTLGGRRMGAVFDIASIRRGDSPDPEILGNDIVVVGYSNAKAVWRDVVDAIPIFNVFRPIGY